LKTRDGIELLSLELRRVQTQLPAHLASYALPVSVEIATQQSDGDNHRSPVGKKTPAARHADQGGPGYYKHWSSSRYRT
jgi:hypothetical protein